MPKLRPKLSPSARTEYEAARNARWRLYGTIGRLRLVQSVLTSIAHDPGLKLDTRIRASDIKAVIDILLSEITPPKRTSTHEP